MADKFDAIIIGSGFGANVVLTELVKNPALKKILVLERGVWWYSPERPLPDYFKDKKEPIQYWPRPNNNRGLLELLSVVKTQTIDMRNFGDRPQPLYYYNSFDDVDILVASGVGGGSLIYSNVSVMPFSDGGQFPIMQDWPEKAKLKSGDYGKAVDWMTGFRGKPAQVVTRFPTGGSSLDRIKQGAADADPELLLGRSRWLREVGGTNLAGFDRIKSWEPLDLQIYDYTSPKITQNQDGTVSVQYEKIDPGKPACERQGRCFLGCLPGSRHTLNKTLVNQVLTKPEFAGKVEVRPLSEVEHIEPAQGGGYLIKYKNHRVGDHDPQRTKEVQAPLLVLAAGVLGTTKMLLRSQDKMTFSQRLGRRFSTNGDGAGFIRYAMPFKYPLWTTRGPINTSHVMYKASGTNTFINVEDAGVPQMFADVVKRGLEAYSNGVSRDPLLSGLDLMWNVAKDNSTLEDFVHAPDLRKRNEHQTEDEMLQFTFFFNTMGRDDARGRFRVDGKNGKNLHLEFEGGPLSKDTVYRKMDELMNAMAAAMSTPDNKGEYIRFPFWGKGNQLLDNDFNPERKAITVHPLGGCSIGNSSTDGVVDVEGRVFNTATGGDTVHNGLYVADGSVMPGPLAVNPTLTIVAIAKRIADNIKLAAGAGNP